MVEKLTISRIFRGEQETKYGIKPKVAIKVAEKDDDKWLSTFKVAGTENWKEGDIVSVDVTENNGFLNFVPAQASSNELEDRIKKLEDKVFGTDKEDETINEDEPF